jgi:hypothetical protein
LTPVNNAGGAVLRGIRPTGRPFCDTIVEHRTDALREGWPIRATEALRECTRINHGGDE